MRLDYQNCTIEVDNSQGKVYRDGKLMFKGDGYIAIKFMLQWTNNAKEVQEKFQAQLSMREKCRWQKDDEKSKTEKRMKNTVVPRRSGVRTRAQQGIHKNQPSASPQFGD